MWIWWRAATRIGWRGEELRWKCNIALGKGFDGTGARGTADDSIRSPARTMLAAMRFTSHSQGPATVSSKSLMSNTMPAVGGFERT